MNDIAQIMKDLSVLVIDQVSSCTAFTPVQLSIHDIDLLIYLARVGYNCRQDRLQHSKCSSHCPGGPKAAAEGSLLCDDCNEIAVQLISSVASSYMLADFSFFFSPSFFVGMVDLQAERTQKHGGIVKCATILIIMCFVMLVLLVLKEIF